MRLSVIAGVPDREVLVDRERRSAQVVARPLDGATLAAYRELERRLAETEPEWRIALRPPALPLPAVAIEGGEPTEAGRNRLALAIWGIELRALPGIWGDRRFEIAGVFVNWDQVTTVVAALAVALGLRLLFRRTRLGVAMRACVDNLTAWVTDGVAPPPSCYPRLSDGTLDSRLWPTVDAEGHEIAGLRHPDVSVPLATYLGWNPRHPSIGAPHRLLRGTGSTIPYSPDKILARYPTREAFLTEIRAAADALAAQRYLLASDIPAIMVASTARWDAFANACSPRRPQVASRADV